MARNKKTTDPENRRLRWGVPVLITLVIALIIGFSGELLFFGYYIMMVYNILRDRKTSKRPMLELVLVQPFGVLGVVLLLPAHAYDMLIGPTIFLVMGSMFALIAGFYLLQERDRRGRCTVVTTGTVTGNVKKRTTSDSDSFSYSPTVRYHADGAQREVTWGDGFPSPIPAGTQVELFYNSDDPEEFRFADQKQVRVLHGMVLVFLLLGLAGVLYAVLLLVQRFTVFL